MAYYCWVCRLHLHLILYSFSQVLYKKSIKSKSYSGIEESMLYFSLDLRLIKLKFVPSFILKDLSILVPKIKTKYFDHHSQIPTSFLAADNLLETYRPLSCTVRSKICMHISTVSHLSTELVRTSSCVLKCEHFIAADWTWNTSCVLFLTKARRWRGLPTTNYLHIPIFNHIYLY